MEVKNLTLFKGAATALITPFKDGKIDYVSMGKLVEWQIAQGIDALVVCGTTGEVSTLSKKDRRQNARHRRNRRKLYGQHSAAYQRSGNARR